MLQNHTIFLKFEFHLNFIPIFIAFWADKPEFNKLLCAYDIYPIIHIQKL
jgi:hypothetical protein